MAQEINVQAILAFQRSTLTLQGSATRVIDQTGNKAEMKQINVSNTTVQILTTTAGQPGTTTLGSVGYLFLKNIDLTTANIGYLEIALTDFSNIFAKLEKDDFCLIPVRKSPVGTLYAKGTFPSTAYNIPLLVSF